MKNFRNLLKLMSAVFAFVALFAFAAGLNSKVKAAESPLSKYIDNVVEIADKGTETEPADGVLTAAEIKDALVAAKLDSTFANLLFTVYETGSTRGTTGLTEVQKQNYNTINNVIAHAMTLVAKNNELTDAAINKLRYSSKADIEGYLKEYNTLETDDVALYYFIANMTVEFKQMKKANEQVSKFEGSIEAALNAMAMIETGYVLEGTNYYDLDYIYFQEVANDGHFTVVATKDSLANAKTALDAIYGSDFTKIVNDEKEDLSVYDIFTCSEAPYEPMTFSELYELYLTVTTELAAYNTTVSTFESAVAALVARWGANESLTLEAELKALEDEYAAMCSVPTNNVKALVSAATVTALTTLRSNIEAMKETVQTLINNIDDIGTVYYSAESLAKIVACENAFDALPTDIQSEEYVTNYDVLVAAREAYDEFVAKKDLYVELVDTIVAADEEDTPWGQEYLALKDLYTEIENENKVNQEGYLAELAKEGNTTFDDFTETYHDIYQYIAAKRTRFVAKATEIIKTIEKLAEMKGLNEMVLTVEFEELLKAAREDYEALPDAAKEYVGNINILEACEEAWATAMAGLEAWAEVVNVYPVALDLTEDCRMIDDAAFEMFADLGIAYGKTNLVAYVSTVEAYSAVYEAYVDAREEMDSLYAAVKEAADAMHLLETDQTEYAVGAYDEITNDLKDADEKFGNLPEASQAYLAETCTEEYAAYLSATALSKFIYAEYLISNLVTRVLKMKARVAVDNSVEDLKAVNEALEALADYADYEYEVRNENTYNEVVAKVLACLEMILQDSVALIQILDATYTTSLDEEYDSNYDKLVDVAAELDAVVVKVGTLVTSLEGVKNTLSNLFVVDVAALVNLNSQYTATDAYFGVYQVTYVDPMLAYGTALYNCGKDAADVVEVAMGEEIKNIETADAIYAAYQTLTESQQKLVKNYTKFSEEYSALVVAKALQKTIKDIEGNTEITVNTLIALDLFNDIYATLPAKTQKILAAEKATAEKLEAAYAKALEEKTVLSFASVQAAIKAAYEAADKALQDQIDAINANTGLTEAQAAINALNTKVAALEAAAKDYEAADAVLKAAYEAADAALKAELLAEVAKVAADLAAAKAALEAKDAELAGKVEGVVTAVEAAKTALETKDAELAAAVKALQDAKDAYVAADAALKAELEGKVAAVAADLAKAQTDLAAALALKADATAVEAKVAEVAAAVEAVKAAYAKADTDLKATVDAAIAAVDAKVAAVEAKVAALETKAAALEAADKALAERIQVLEDWKAAQEAKGCKNSVSAYSLFAFAAVICCLAYVVLRKRQANC